MIKKKKEKKELTAHESSIFFFFAYEKILNWVNCFIWSGTFSAGFLCFSGGV